MSRKVEHHKLNDCNNAIEIEVVDEPGAGGASHNYTASFRTKDGVNKCLDIWFQNGTISENGINGITQEVLLAIVIDRLESFQGGPFANPSNQHALSLCILALDALHCRTKDRIERDVEGKMEP